MKRWWPYLVLVLLMALVAGYFWATVPVQYAAPASPDASVRNNPYLAAQQLLDHWGRPSRRIFSTRALFPLPDTDTTLILDGDRGSLGYERQLDLLNWVHDGGNLIIAARYLPPSSGWFAEEETEQDENETRRRDPDSLLSLFEVEVEALPREDNEEDPLALLFDRFRPMEDWFLEYCLSGDASEERLHQCEVLTCQAPQHWQPPAATHNLGDQPRLLQSEKPIRLLYTPLPIDDSTGEPAQVLEASASNEAGETLLRFRVGGGTVTVLTELGLWDNQHLHHFDHARLLADLTARGPVWFVRGIDIPPLPIWLWERFWPLILALVLALAFWLWRRLPRRGPLWRDPARQHTDYLGHLRAIGHFHWRTGQSDRLLASLRHQVQRRIALQHADPVKALALTAKRLDIPEHTLSQALEQTPADRAQCVAMVALLQQVRQRIRSQP